MTMQTDHPIQHTQMSTMNRPLDWLLYFGQGRENASLDMDQPYQRGDVWGLTRRRNLIRSMLLGIPIPSLVINDRFSARFKEPGYSQDREWSYAIVDGKQRVTTFLMFARDEFAVPASWYKAADVIRTEDTEDGPYVRFSGLSESERRGFESLPLGTTEGKFSSLAAEEFIFDLVNFGGVAQGDTDADVTAPITHLKETHQ